MGLALGLGVMKLVDLIEAMIPWPQGEGMKVFYAIILSVVAAAVLAPELSDGVLMASSTLGFSALGHGIETNLLTLRDMNRAKIIHSMRPPQGGRSQLF